MAVNGDKSGGTSVNLNLGLDHAGINLIVEALKPLILEATKAVVAGNGAKKQGEGDVIMVKEVEKLSQRPLDIREQILANARILWPILLARKQRTYGSFGYGRYLQSASYYYHQPHKNGKIDYPEMEVIVVGTGTTIHASVVRQSVNGSDGAGQKYTFIESNDTDSAEKAVQKLFELTMVMLNKVTREHIVRETTDNPTQIEGLGFHYVGSA